MLDYQILKTVHCILVEICLSLDFLCLSALLYQGKYFADIFQGITYLFQLDKV